MNKMNIDEVERTVKRYDQRYKEFGYSPKSLGWGSGKQDIRFEVLTSQYDFNQKSVLDIGCGFGDLNLHLSSQFHDYEYTGCDLYENFISEGQKRFPHAKFICGDFLQIENLPTYDWAVASGPFNHVFENGENYEFIQNVMLKTFSLVKDGFSFDFISDKVDYKENHIFYAAPETILSFAYSLSRNVVLRNNYMPFEFSIFVFKDNSFSKEQTIFNRYLDDKNI